MGVKPFNLLNCKNLLQFEWLWKWRTSNPPLLRASAFQRRINSFTQFWYSSIQWYTVPPWFIHSLGGYRLWVGTYTRMHCILSQLFFVAYCHLCFRPSFFVAMASQKLGQYAKIIMFLLINIIQFVFKVVYRVPAFETLATHGR